MSGIFLKICGITTADAAAAVADSNADAIGFVFAPGSPRELTAENARLLTADLPSSVETVGVFRNQPIDEVLRTASRVGLTTVQLHGDEGDADFDRLRAEGFDTIRALSIENYRRLTLTGGVRPDDRLLVDAVSPGGGATFTPSLLESVVLPDFWILAGGLTPHNVADHIRTMHPGGVDVSSGVEASRGVKDPALIRAFVDAARSA